MFPQTFKDSYNVRMNTLKYILTSDFQIDHRAAGNARLASGLKCSARVFSCVQVRHVPYQQTTLLDRILSTCGTLIIQKLYSVSNL